VAHFSAPKNVLQTTTIHHTSHHVITIKKPHPDTHFSQNTPKNPSKTAKAPSHPGAQLFLFFFSGFSFSI
jgi:hypothetical protein